MKEKKGFELIFLRGEKLAEKKGTRLGLVKTSLRKIGSRQSRRIQQKKRLATLCAGRLGWINVSQIELRVNQINSIAT